MNEPDLNAWIGTASLTWPLYVVAQEPRNPEVVHTWATKKLARIATIAGYRQAGVLADAIANGLWVSASI